MTRLLAFNYIDNEYLIQENNETIFQINADDLRFDSLKFYQGLYQRHNGSTKIVLENQITNDPLKKGNYIFQWLNKLIENIYIEFHGVRDDFPGDTEQVPQGKIIPLYELAACAGNGFYTDGDVSSEDHESDNSNADFAIRISGKSMEPTIPDGSIALIEDVEVLAHEDIGIFVLDGEVMCKRYLIIDGYTYLAPDNDSDEFKTIRIGENNRCDIQGKVLGIEN